MKNVWCPETGLELWNKQLSFDGDEIWVNIGFVFPFVCTKKEFQKTVAVSAYNYNSKFN